MSEKIKSYSTAEQAIKKTKNCVQVQRKTEKEVKICVSGRRATRGSTETITDKRSNQ